jgi:nucleoside 2-deoxyribosyltransferase
MKLYVASSWRNPFYNEVLAALRNDGHECYDFRNPFPGNTGFKWDDIDPNWKEWTPEQWHLALHTPIANRGFRCDFEAMTWADGCVLVMPSGRSAHLEAGWFAGRNKPVWAYVPEKAEPELMYKLLSGAIYGTLPELLVGINRDRIETLKEAV